MSRPSLALLRGLLVSAILIPLILAAGTIAPPASIHAAAPSASPTPAATASPGAAATPGSGDSGASTLPIDPGESSASLLQDETTFLQSVPNLSSAVPLSTLPPIKGSVATLESGVISLLGRVQSSSLPTATKSTLLDELQNLNLRLGPALDLQDRIGTLRSDENTLLQARVDAQAAVDKLSAQVQINLDKLRVGVQTTVGADVVASASSLTVTVNGSADTIQAQLGAQVNRLVVNVLTDIDVLHIATLHATADVDTSRLNVNLFALVKKLTLDLNLLLTDLKVTVHADVSATVMAEASLTASLAAEIDGLRVNLTANVDTKLSGLDGLLTTLIDSLNSTLAAATSSLQGIQSQVH